MDEKVPNFPLIKDESFTDCNTNCNLPIKKEESFADYNINCIDCKIILGISKECLYKKEIRCLKCAQKERTSQKTKITNKEGGG